MLDFILQLGIVATFIVFAICMWILKKEQFKQKKLKDEHGPPNRLDS